MTTTDCPFCDLLTATVCCPSANLYRMFEIEQVATGWRFYWYSRMMLHPTPEAARAALIQLIKESMQ